MSCILGVKKSLSEYYRYLYYRMFFIKLEICKFYIIVVNIIFCSKFKNKKITDKGVCLLDYYSIFCI